MELNFFEPFLSSKKDGALKKGIVPFIIAGIILFLIIGYTVYSLVYIVFLQKSIDNVERELNEPAMIAKIKEIDDKEKQIADIETEKAFLESVDGGINDIDTVTKKLIEIVSSNVTNDLYLSAIKVDLKDIEIAGIAKSRLEIAQFEYNIRDTKLFDNIYISNINFNDEIDAYEFNMKFNAKNEIYEKANNTPKVETKEGN